MIADIDIKDFEGYQQEAWKFAKPTAKNPSYLFGNLGGETGEVLSLWSKSIRDGVKDTYSMPMELTKELGDVLWMVSGIATYYGLSLQDIAEANIVKLKSRQKRGVIGGSGDDR
jgi:NTP pyrophosphatase (non-canonical NTP hydrolase)